MSTKCVICEMEFIGGPLDGHVEKQVEQGKLLVVANGDPKQAAEAQCALGETNAEDIHVHAPTSADAPEVDDS